MKVEQIGPTFWVPEKTVNFFGVKPVIPSYTLKMRKSHKKSAHVYAYTHAYTQIRDGGGRSAPSGTNSIFPRGNIDYTVTEVTCNIEYYLNPILLGGGQICPHHHVFAYMRVCMRIRVLIFCDFSSF